MSEYALTLVDWGRLAGAVSVFGVFMYTAYIFSLGMLGGKWNCAAFSVALLIVYFLLHTAFFLLAPLGLFHLAIPLSLICAGVTLRKIPGYKFPPVATRVKECLPESNGIRFLLLWSAFLFVISCARIALAPPLSFDALTYHASKAALWAQTGSIDLLHAPSGWQEFRLRFGGSEVIRSWTLLLCGTDALAGMVDVVEWLGILAGCWSLGRLCRLNSEECWYSVIFVMWLPILQSLAGSSYVEPCLTFFCITFINLLILYIRWKSAPHLLVLACLAVSMAIGVKETALPVGVLFAVGMLIAIFATKDSFRDASLKAVFVMLLLLVCASPWPMYLFSQTGYFLPFDIDLFGIKLGAQHPIRAWYIAAFTPEASDVAFIESAALFTVLGSPFSGYPNLSLTFVALCVLSFLIKSPQKISPLDVGIVVYFLSVVALYFHPSLLPVKVQSPFDVSRFLLHGVVPLVPLLFRGLSSKPKIVFLLLAVQLAGASLRITKGWASHEFVWVSLATFLLFLMLFIAVGAQINGRKRLACLVLLLLPLSVIRSTQRESYIRSSNTHTVVERPWAEAAIALDEKDAQTVALTVGPKPSVDNYMPFFFLGSHLQHKLIYVSPLADGGVMQAGRAVNQSEVSERMWLQRIQSNAVDSFISLAPASIELKWARSAPKLIEVFGSDEWGCFKNRQN